jgi:hypothetical protein
MPRHVTEHRPAVPVKRVKDGAEGYFFVGETARMLGLTSVDYRQIRTLFRFVREQAGTPVGVDDQSWSRFTLIDIACLDALMPLCGGLEALSPNRRLVLRPVRRACSSLRGLGFANPLLEVPMRRVGSNVYAVSEGSLVDPNNGQLLLQDALDKVQDFHGSLKAAPSLFEAIESERQQARRRRRPRIAISQMEVDPTRRSLADSSRCCVSELALSRLSKSSQQFEAGNGPHSNRGRGTHAPYPRSPTLSNSGASVVLT